eukprot:snap_masked-scaffold487_size158652-processed-gene-0.14 protein:Tk00182 transcript:snap_masked-scaffold487_size158652-processed-gene-0.14-mRNA-1 annotation:"hypothetical protein Phum_PHUM296360"
MSALQNPQGGSAPGPTFFNPAAFQSGVVAAPPIPTAPAPTAGPMSRESSVAPLANPPTQFVPQPHMTAYAQEAPATGETYENNNYADPGVTPSQEAAPYYEQPAEGYPANYYYAQSGSQAQQGYDANAYDGNAYYANQDYYDPAQSYYSGDWTNAPPAQPLSAEAQAPAYGQRPEGGEGAYPPPHDYPPQQPYGGEVEPDPSGGPREASVPPVGLEPPLLAAPLAHQGPLGVSGPPDVASPGQRHPPDILLNDPFMPMDRSDRNHYMQTGQLSHESTGADADQVPYVAPTQPREPVDGGNEEDNRTPAVAPSGGQMGPSEADYPDEPPQHLPHPVDDSETSGPSAGGWVPPHSESPARGTGPNHNAGDVDIPLDRLVLGQSDQFPPTLPPIQAGPPHVQERVVTGTSGHLGQASADGGSPAKTIGQMPKMMTSTPTLSQGSPPQDGEPVIRAQPQEERSEAVGSERKDESVMGPPPSNNRPPPPPSSTRDVTGADTPPPHGAKKLDSELDQDIESEISRDSTKFRKPEKNRTQHHNSTRRQHHRRSPSPPITGDEESSSEDRFSHSRPRRDRRYRNDTPPRAGPAPDRRDRQKARRVLPEEDRSKPRHYRGADFRDERDRSYRDDRSFRDDRSYYDESMNQSRRGGERRRGYDDRREMSRPSSRAGSVYEDRYYDRDRYANDYVMRHSSFYHQPMPYMQPHQYPQMLPDRAAMDTFEKHWKYYMQHPALYEQLKVSNPAQYESLNNYYRMCGEYLRLPAIASPAREAAPLSPTRPDSRASVHSGQSEQDGGTHPMEVVPPASHNTFQPIESGYQAEPRQEAGGDQSAIYNDPNADPRYQPTFAEEPELAQLEHYQEHAYPREVEQSGHDHRRITPAKFSSPHVKASFGVLGLMAKVTAKNPLDGQNAVVEIHSVQALLKHCDQSKELAQFPGPLVPGTTHKGEVIQFCQAKIQAASSKEVDIVDKASYILLWDLLILLLRQKNAIDGSDIAELLLKGRNVQTPYAENGGEEANGLPHSLPSSASEMDVVHHDRTLILNSAPEKSEKVTMKFRDYLLFGHKKEGLEYAMKHGLWGHALFLASKMDERSYSNVMLRFANGLAVNDPLQTLYQLMSGRQPIAVKECADSHWGDWRPHLAMILSNPSGKEGLDRRSIVTLGDTLMDKGFLYAAHFCYLMANLDFGPYTNSNAKLVLIGSDRTLSLPAFATNEALQCTEIFEYVQKLSNPEYVMNSLQYFKFTYTIRLLDAGIASSALYYCEQIAKALTKNPQSIIGDILQPQEFLEQVLELSERLKYLDPMYTTNEGEIKDMGDPEWLTKLKALSTNYSYPSSDSGYQYEGGSGYDYGDSAQPYDPSQVSNNNYEQGYYENPQDYPVKSGDQAHPLDAPVPTDTHPADSATPSMDDPIMMKSIPEDGPFEIGPPSSLPPMMNPSSLGGLAPMTNGPPLPMREGHDSSSSVTPNPSGSNSPVKYAPTGGAGGNYFNNVRSAVPPPMAAGSPAKQPPPPAKAEAPKGKGAAKGGKEEAGPGILGRFLGRFIKPPNQAHLPDDQSQTIYYDEGMKKWVDRHASPEDEASAMPAPPSDFELSRHNSSAEMAGNGPSTGGLPSPQGSAPLMPPGGGLAAPPLSNKFAGGLSKRRGLSGRIDVFKNSQSAPSLAQADGSMPPSMMPPTGSGPAPPSLFVPGPVPEAGPAEAAPSGGAPEVADGPPMFFNPNQFANAPAAAGAGSTKRNRYA